jgi:hypothetical protein
MIRVGVARVPAAVLVTSAAAVALAVAWLAAPPLGTDLSAQVARADFFAEHGWAPIDFRWYGGVSPHGYSVVTPPLMAWFGPRPVGAAAGLVSAVAFVLLLLRTGARRPLLGGVIGAACLFGNLASGRVTFAVGVALGLLALLLLSRRSCSCAGDISGVSGHNGVHNCKISGVGGAGVLAALASAASPVAGLFVGLAGTALCLASIMEYFGVSSGVSRKNSMIGGATVAVGAAVPLAVMAGLFGSGGWMNMTRQDMVHAAVASLAVAALVPHRVVRIGALLSAAGVLAAYLVHSPVGLNAIRLSVIFALPVVAAYATLPGWLGRLREPVVWLVLVVLAWWQPPVLDTDLARAGDPTASRDYFAPLRDELARRAPAGRVEVVPTADYWESAYLGDRWLARGWLRQVDLDRNRLFFDGTLDAASYQEWLTANGVSYVALADAELSWVGQREGELVRGGLPYLTPVWDSPDWTLYEVAGDPGIVAGAAVVEAGADAVVVRADRAGEILVRVRWSRWLAVSGEACLAEAEGGWTVVRVAGPGEYRVGGSVTGAGPRC